MAETSIFLAKAWGLYLATTSLAFLINQRNFNRIMAEVNNYTFALMSGFLSLVVGLLTVLSHNVWAGGWPVVITVFGWLALIKGILRLTWPELVGKWTNLFRGKRTLMNVILLVMVVLGIYLAYVGFSA